MYHKSSIHSLMENADWVRKIKVIINSTQISLDSGFPGCQCRIQDAFLSSFLLETLTAFSEDFRIKKFEIFFFGQNNYFL